LYKKFNLLKDSSLLKIHLEFQVTSLPISYFNIFKELCSVFFRFMRNAKITTLSESSKNFLHKINPFKNNCLSKADAKISALFLIRQNFFRFFSQYISLA